MKRYYAALNERGVNHWARNRHSMPVFGMTSQTADAQLKTLERRASWSGNYGELAEAA